MIDPKTFDIQCTGYSVEADWYEADNTNEIILSLIGWGSNRKKYQDLNSALCEKTGHSSLVFDYSGHGDSPIDIDSTRPAQHFLEVICAFDWLKAKHPNAKITVIGTSYGSYLASQLTEYREFDRLVLRAPAIYIPSDFYTLNGLIQSDERWAEKDAYRRNIDELAKHPMLLQAPSFKGKTLVVVHENDDQIPAQTSDAYIKAFGADVYIAKDLPHSLYNQPREKIEQYQNAISDWLKK